MLAGAWSSAGPQDITGQHWKPNGDLKSASLAQVDTELLVEGTQAGTIKRGAQFIAYFTPIQVIRLPRARHAARRQECSMVG
jgi:hypothetical protein